MAVHMIYAECEKLGGITEQRNIIDPNAPGGRRDEYSCILPDGTRCSYDDVMDGVCGPTGLGDDFGVNIFEGLEERHLKLLGSKYKTVEGFIKAHEGAYKQELCDVYARMGRANRDLADRLGVKKEGTNHDLIEQVVRGTVKKYPNIDPDVLRRYINCTVNAFESSGQSWLWILGGVGILGVLGAVALRRK